MPSTNGKNQEINDATSSYSYSRLTENSLAELKLLKNAKEVMQSASDTIRKVVSREGHRDPYQFNRIVGILEASEQIDENLSINENLTALRKYRNDLDLLGEIKYSNPELTSRIRSATESIEFLQGLRETGRPYRWYFPLEQPGAKFCQSYRYSKQNSQKNDDSPQTSQLAHLHNISFYRF